MMEKRRGFGRGLSGLTIPALLVVPVLEVDWSDMERPLVQSSLLSSSFSFSSLSLSSPCLSPSPPSSPSPFFLSPVCSSCSFVVDSLLATPFSRMAGVRILFSSRPSNPTLSIISRFSL
eukprot:Lithocolla_globosa_v1_NODE_1463_length_2558_cov_6.559329.p3 type:complete len:119 gc:universal NODE_1463_length_2558_cov_6.559329:1910-2266(+)